MRVKITFFLFFWSFLWLPVQAQMEQDDIIIRSVTVIDGTGSPAVRDQTVVIRDGKITCVGECEEPEEAIILDGKGKFLIPGLVDSHVHYMSSGWLDTFPMVDVSEDFPYEEAVEELEAHPDRFHQSFLCSGVTAVFDTGGFKWTLDLKERLSDRTDAPHLAVAGPLNTLMEIPLPDSLRKEMSFYLEDEESIKQAVEFLAEKNADAVKMHRFDLAGSKEELHKKLGILKDEAEKAGLPVIANVPELEVAKAAVRAGATMLVYSIEDQLVDEEFLELAKEKNLIYVPSLGVADSFKAAAEGKFSEEIMPLDCVHPETREKVLRTHEFTVKEKKEDLARNRNTPVPSQDQNLKNIRMENLRRINAAGITVATGSSSGAPLMLHGPGTANEMRVMVEAGMSPMEVIVATTKNGAMAMDRDDFGTVEVGKIADLVLLSEDPLTDIKNVRTVEVVIRGGRILKRN